MNSFFHEQYIKYFDSFIIQLKELFINTIDQDIIIDNEFKIIDELNDTEKINRGVLYNLLITDELFDLFLNSKIKIFSHKNNNTLELSQSLLGNTLSLKNLLNNQSDDIKKIIWKNLHNLYILSEFLKSSELQNSERIVKLNKQININNPDPNSDSDQNQENDNEKIKYDKNDTKKNLQKMLDVEINSQTSDMIDDIVDSFDNILSGNLNSNPLAGIMEISQTISNKYADKIKKGDIELDKIMKSIMCKIPGMEQMMSSILKSSNNNTNNTKIIIDETFSTSDITLGKLEDKNTSNMKFGSMLKLADQFGVIPGGKSNDQSLNVFGNILNSVSTDNPSNFMNDMFSNITKEMGNENNSNLLSNLINGMTSGLGQENGMPQGIEKVGKMLNIIKKLENSQSKNDINNIKEEMDTFLSNDFGIDINKLNNDMVSLMK